MSDSDAITPVDPRAEQLVEEFIRLAPPDRDLVVALVQRLSESVGPEATAAAVGYPPDVAFMDFEE